MKYSIIITIIFMVFACHNVDSAEAEDTSTEFDTYFESNPTTQEVIDGTQTDSNIPDTDNFSNNSSDSNSTKTIDSTTTDTATASDSDTNINSTDSNIPLDCESEEIPLDKCGSSGSLIVYTGDIDHTLSVDRCVFESINVKCKEFDKYIHFTYTNELIHVSDLIDKYDLCAQPEGEDAQCQSFEEIMEVYLEGFVQDSTGKYECVGNYIMETHEFLYSDMYQLQDDPENVYRVDYIPVWENPDSTRFCENGCIYVDTNIGPYPDCAEE